MAIRSRSFSEGPLSLRSEEEPRAVPSLITPPEQRVSMPDEITVAPLVAKILASGVLTNGATVRELEARAAAYLGVRHCIAVASGTTALTVALAALEAVGEAVMPSLSSTAILHAVRSAGLDPVLADVDAASLAMTAETAQPRIGTRTAVIVATHPLGAPADAEALAALADTYGVRIVFDAASAFGAEHAGRMVGGFGDAEIFSLSSTRPLVAGEGGLIATDDDLLAERCRRTRDDEDHGRISGRLVCTDARMSELHAALALASFDSLPERLRLRRGLARRYRGALQDVPGVSFPRVMKGDLGTHHGFVVLLDPAFGCEPEAVAASLQARGIDAHLTHPMPGHGKGGRAHVGAGRLPGTASAASRALSLPIWDRMQGAELDAVVRALRACRIPNALV